MASLTIFSCELRPMINAHAQFLFFRQVTAFTIELLVFAINLVARVFVMVEPVDLLPSGIIVARLAFV